MSTSVFEIIGPIMVGPSSSHTAGMARIGLMANQIAALDLEHITLRMSPVLKTTYHGHRTDAALVAGAMGWAEDSPLLRHSLELAPEQGIGIDYAFYPPNIYHPNAVQLEMRGKNGEEVSVRGISIGGGSLCIEAIDEQKILLESDQYNLVLWGEGAKAAAESVADGEKRHAESISVVAFKTAPADSLMGVMSRMPGVSRVRLVKPVLTYGATVSELLKLSRYEDAVKLCSERGLTLPELAMQYEMDRSSFSREDIRALMHKELEIMRRAVDTGVNGKNEMLYGLTSGCDGKRLMGVAKEGKTISGGIVPVAVAKALGVMEYNASMGCIVAAPTAGSAGIVPGCMFTLQEEHGFSDDEIVDALFVSAITGVIMAHRNVSFSGAVGGCQGEVGVSSAIAAAGIASLFSKDPAVIFEAMGMCMKNLLGLVCDPIAGPIEVPCIKRNAVGVANAFISADMACAGIASYIPPDEVIDALIDVQKRLPMELRATTIGGLACSHTGVCLREKLKSELVDA